MNDMKKNNNALLKTIAFAYMTIAALLVAIPESRCGFFRQSLPLSEASRRAGEAAAAAKAEDTPYQRGLR